MATRGVIFKEAPVIKPNRSWFDNSHKHDTTLNFGELAIGHCSDHLASEVIKLKHDSFGRLETMLSPTTGEVDLMSYWFYVNKRHIWPDWKKFRPNNDQLKTWEQMRSFVSPTMPYITLNDLCDYSVLKANVFSVSNGNIYYKPYPYAVASIALSYTQDGDDYRCYMELLEIDRDPLKPLNTRPESTLGENFIGMIHVAYLRNFQEVVSKGGNLWYKDDYLVRSCNIFSAGTPFHYMGLNLSSLQKEYVKYQLESVLAILDDQFNIDGKLFSHRQDNYQVYRWLEQHFVCCMTFLNVDRSLGDDNIGYTFFPGDVAEFTDIEGLSDLSYSSSHTVNNQFAHDVDAGFYYNGDQKYITKWWTKAFDARINTMPIRAYEFIYDEYFRDQNWIPVNEYTDFTRNGQERYETAEQRRYFLIRKKAWPHDPYTSSLPGPQRGDATRFLLDAEIKVDNIGPAQSGTRQYGIGTTNPNGGSADSVRSTVDTVYSADIFVDLSAATIERFRYANACQRYKELFARTGGRYVEWQQGVMGATISDIEDERPMYIYGSRNPIQMSEVVQTSATNVDTGQPLGDLAGRAIFVGKGDYIEFVCPDDGYLVQIVTAVPHLSYQSGIPPMFTRHNWLDFPIPMFAQLGEEQVKTESLWFTGVDDFDKQSFGYQSRYWDWKHTRDMTTGQLTESLDYWTFTRIFEDEPINGRDFIEVNVDYRQFAVQDPGVHHVIVSLYNSLDNNLQLPIFGIPTL